VACSGVLLPQAASRARATMTREERAISTDQRRVTSRTHHLQLPSGRQSVPRPFLLLLQADGSRRPSSASRRPSSASTASVFRGSLVGARRLKCGVLRPVTHTHKIKVKERIVLSEIHLRTTGHHLSTGSHSVICHPTEVTAPPSPQPGRLVLDLSTP